MCSVLDSLEREYKREDDWLSRYLVINVFLITTIQGHQGHNCDIFFKIPNLDHLVTRHASADQDRATLIAQLINKHQEQKEAFLKVIIIIIIIPILITIINII